jgi:hypothetical protein
MKSTKIDPYAIDYSNRKGNGIGIYVTEGNAPDPGHITNYYRISGSTSDHVENVTGIIRAVSPQSYVYAQDGYTLPSSTNLAGYNNNPQVYICSNSWGSGDSGDYTTSDRDWDDLVYDDRVVVFKSAGNNGDDDGYCSSPGNGLNVITVGNYKDYYSILGILIAINDINDSSSYLNPETGNSKPEIVAPGTNVTAGGHTMTGTSMAAPHAAAFAADLMGAYTWLKLKPYYMKAKMLSGATKSISGGEDKVGLGGIDFYSAYYNGTNTSWEGSNGSFSSFDSNDVNPNNGYIDREVYLSSSYSDVQIVVCWLNRGSYTYNHRDDSHPIGMDMDMYIYDPNGSYVAGSSSWDNPFEVVRFDPSVSGTYTIKIKRYANRDTSCNLRTGLSINW